MKVDVMERPPPPRVQVKRWTLKALGWSWHVKDVSRVRRKPGWEMAQQESEIAHRLAPDWAIGSEAGRTGVRTHTRGPVHTCVYVSVCVCITFISCTASHPSVLLCGIRRIAQPGDLTDGTSLSRIDLGGLAWAGGGGCWAVAGDWDDGARREVGVWLSQTERWRTVSGMQSHSQGPRCWKG